MRIGVLVGACGLALAGAAHAERATAFQSRGETIDNEFTRARDAAIGKAGTARRLAFMDEAREKIRSGRIDPRRSFLSQISDEFINGDPRGSHRGIETLGARVAPTVGNPNPWAASIDADDMHDGFEDPAYVKHMSLNLLSDLVPLGGQAAPNGNNWKSAATQFYNGLVDNTLLTTATGWSGDPAGPDSLGDRGTFFWEPRGTLFGLTTTAYNSGFHWARLDHAFYVPTGSTPVVSVIDWYMDGLETFTWHRPNSSPEGFIVTNVFMGGYDFASFTAFTNPDNKIDRPIILGLKPGSFDEGEFFAPVSHFLKTGEWYNLSIRQAVDSISMWIRDSETIGVYGFSDASSNLYPSDFSNFPADGNTPFGGEIYENDWVQFYPGLTDDPATTSIVEGSGLALNEFLQAADVFNDSTNSPAGAPLVAFGLEEFQSVGGFDPLPEQVPGFMPTDWGFDNWTVMGDPFNFADPQPDATVPYIDDFELWVPGPVAVQGLRFFDSNSFSEIIDSQNHTTGIGLDGDPNPEQSLRQTNIFGNGVYRESVDLELFEEDLTIRVGDVTPLTLRSFVRVSDNATSRGFDSVDINAGFQTSRVFIGGRDSNGIVDNQLYMWADNDSNGTLNFDNSQPADDVTGINEIWDGVQNRSFIPAPLETLANAPSVIVPNSWHEITQQISMGSVDPDDLADQTFFLDGVELRIDADFFSGLGAGTPNPGTDGLTIDQVTLESGYEVAGLLSQVFWDDLRIDGLVELQPNVLTVGSAPYSAQPAFGLPYDDPFDGYVSEFPITQGQSSTPFLGQLFTSNTGNQIDVLPGSGLSPGDSVFLYTVDNVVSTPGSPPAGLAPGSTVAVEANFPQFRDPTDTATPGSVGSSARVKFRNNSLQLQAEVDMTLQSATPSAWNGADAVVGRYFFTLEERWQGDVNDGFVLDIESVHPGFGDALVITQTEDDAAAAEAGVLEDTVVSTLPAAIASPGLSAEMSFDLFISSDTATPRGRTSLALRGPTFEEFTITTFVFGGPHNYEDTDADGQPNNDDPSSQSDPARLYVLRPNGIAATPPGLLVQEAFDVPLNTWLRVSTTIGPGGDWALDISDSSLISLHSTSGVAIETTGVAGFGLSGTAGLDIQLGNDPGGNGRPKLDPIVWTSLGESASAEGGSDARSTQFNSIPPKYFYQEIFDIDLSETPDLTLLPDVVDVNQATGATQGTRDIEFNDVIVLWNDTGSGSGSGTGVTYADANPRNVEWEYTEDGGATILGSGRWVPLGMPGDLGLNDPVPAGGITANSAPYNPDVPFRSILMGSIVNLPALPPETDNHQVLIDNLHLDVTGCQWDVSAPLGVVDGADLAVLLASWTPAPYNAEVDGNSDGVIDGADLAAMLAFWGPCP